MKNKSRRGGLLIFFLLCAIFCLMTVALFYVARTLPQQVVERFGKASPDLSSRDQFVYSLKLLYFENDLKNSSSTVNEPINFRIEYGENVQSITYRLDLMGLITNPDAFLVFLAYTGLDRTIQAGDYLIQPGSTSVDLAYQFQDATPSEVTFSILKGWRLEEIAMSLPTSGLTIAPDEFLRLTNNYTGSNNLPADWDQGSSLEGLFYPGSYLLPRNLTFDELVGVVIKQFNQQVSPLADSFARQGLNLRDAVILASIVEKEAVLEEEQPMIASVFFNRLELGMRLESDPTVQYALGYNEDQQTWWKNPLTGEDLQFDSPYNTYLYTGLPPGPIGNPGISALRAVAFPAQTDYLYFRAACDASGRHSFAITFEEHLENGCE